MLYFLKALLYHLRMKEPYNTHLQRATQVLGGQLVLARALKVTPQAVHQWLSGKRSIPAERCPSIERLTNGVVTCEQLRPDIEWQVLRTPERRLTPSQKEEAHE